MDIDKKIYLGYGIVLALFVIVMASFAYQVNVMNASYENLNVYMTDNTVIQDIKLSSQIEYSEFRGYIAFPYEREMHLNSMHEQDRVFDAAVEKLRLSLLTQADQERIGLLNEIVAIQTKYVAVREKGLLMVQNNISGFSEYNIQEIRPLHEDIFSRLDKLTELKTADIKQARIRTTETSDFQTRLQFIGLILAVVLGIGIAYYTVRNINKQFHDSEDVRNRSEGQLRKQFHEIMEVSNVLVSSSGEIVATNTQLATSASETATAVSETSVTAEELKQTAQLSSEKAKSVSESAQKAATIAQQGKVAVVQTIEGMNRIKLQADSVAESIIKLSEKNEAIGEIITTVNDLAEQSNLLAVNAAIEAAKAGEQGKGFTVVAQEIKSLAEQSKHATAQIRSILSDIQKATGSAVMATEQVSKAVDAGVKQSNEAGEYIVKLPDSVSEAAQAGIQIAASSQQQFVGINQIVLAMENIKHAAIQNEEGAKRAEKSARNLNDLGQKLKVIIETGGKNG